MSLKCCYKKPLTISSSNFFLLAIHFRLCMLIECHDPQKCLTLCSFIRKVRSCLCFTLHQSPDSQRWKTHKQILKRKNNYSVWRQRKKHFIVTFQFGIWCATFILALDLTWYFRPLMSLCLCSLCFVNFSSWYINIVCAICFLSVLCILTNLIRGSQI